MTTPTDIETPDKIITITHPACQMISGEKQAMPRPASRNLMETKGTKIRPTTTRQDVPLRHPSTTRHREPQPSFTRNTKSSLSRYNSTQNLEDPLNSTMTKRPTAGVKNASFAVPIPRNKIRLTAA